MVKSPARLGWLQELGATAAAAGLWPGRGGGERGGPIPPTAPVGCQLTAWLCRDRVGAVPSRAPVQSSAPSYSMHSPAELVKGGAGNVPGGLCHAGNIQGRRVGTGSVQQCVLDVGVMDVGVLGAGWRCWRCSRRMMESRCSQRRSSRSL